jgi:hypothetical protein
MIITERFYSLSYLIRVCRNLRLNRFVTNVRSWQTYGKPNTVSVSFSDSSCREQWKNIRCAFERSRSSLPSGSRMKVSKPCHLLLASPVLNSLRKREGRKRKLSPNEAKSPKNVDGSQTGRITLEATTDEPTTKEIVTHNRIWKRHQRMCLRVKKLFIMNKGPQKHDHPLHARMMQILPSCSG